MLVLRFSEGRLGNQMFEYAAAYALAKSHHEPLALFRLEVSLYPCNVYSLDDLKIEDCHHYRSVPFSLYGYILKKYVFQYVRLLLKKLFRKKLHLAPKPYTSHVHDVVNEMGMAYHPIMLDRRKKIHILSGFWQSHKYFEAYRDDIIRQYTPSFRLSTETEKLIAALEADAYPVSVHVRRGDYLQLNLSVPDAYYHRAIELVRERHPEAVFYVFSDDIAHCKKLFENVNAPMVHAEHQAKVKAFEDIWAMSKCRANIICNSTFSWWGAYLNTHEDKLVIVPSAIRRTNNADCICDGWIELEA